MRIWIGLILCAAALCAAEKPAAGKTSTKAAKRQAAGTRKPAALTLPPGAVEAGPDTWHHTDRQGRKWVYRKTPWGLTRLEEKQGAANKEGGSTQAAVIRAFDDGEHVRFERPGPFGVYRWRRSKSELNDEERRAWERAQASRPQDSGGQ